MPNLGRIILKLEAIRSQTERTIVSQTVVNAKKK
jgi:hypothetical protein